MINIELTDNTIEYDGYTLYQIKAINPYKHNKVYKDILGGYIDKTSIITDNAWIEKGAKVYNCCVITGESRIGEDVIVNNYSTVSDSIIEDKAIITNDSHIQDNSTIESGSVVDNSTVKDNSIVRGTILLRILLSVINLVYFLIVLLLIVRYTIMLVFLETIQLSIVLLAVVKLKIKLSKITVSLIVQ